MREKRYSKESFDVVIELFGALKEARNAIADFPASLGYQYTHLRKIDAAIAKAFGFIEKG